MRTTLLKWVADLPLAALFAGHGLLQARGAAPHLAAWLLFCTGLGWAATLLTSAPSQAGTVSGRWREVQGAGPPARWGHVAVYDADGDRVLLFGGRGQDDAELGDLWELSLRTETWRQLHPSGPSPAPRFTAAAIADPPRRRLVLMGGYTGHAASDEVWAFAWTTQQWARLPSGPPARFDHAMAAGQEKAWVYGGFRDFETWHEFGDLWELDLRTDTWRQLPAGPTPPPPRTNLTMGFDAPGHRLYIFGGHDRHPPPLTDAWSYALAASRWAPLSPAGPLPDAVTHQAYAFDPVCRALWMMGGDRNDKKNVASTWALTVDPLRFVRLTAAREPPPRQHAAMVLDGAGRLIVFGGMGGERLLADTWILERAPRCPPGG
jgi:hypothetical protein